LDVTFGNNGTVITTLDGGPEQSCAVAIQSDGKIVVAGDALDPDASWDIMLARYTMDGALDVSFGSGGVIFTDFGSNGYDGSTSVVLQRDGKIMVGGISQGDEDDFALARYDTRVIGMVSVGGELIPIGETNVKAKFNTGGPCMVSVTKTIAFPVGSPNLGKMPMYWEISADCSGAYNLDLVFCYTDAELYNSVSVTEDNLIAFKKTGEWNWVSQGGTVDSDANCVALSNVTSLGYWALGRTLLHVYLPLVAK